MKKIVIMPGGFHPWHAGHTALYHAAKSAFPSADVFVAATSDTSSRPFPFKVKKMLAQAAGVPANRFIQVKNPFRAEEITQMYDPAETQLIFVRSEKDQDQNPKPGGVKKDGSASYLQPYRRMGLEPMNRHAYMHYLPVAQFGPGMTSATEIRAKWPDMSLEQKAGLVKTIYPAASGNVAAVDKLVEILDSVMMPEQSAEMVETIGDDPIANQSINNSDSATVDALVQQLAMVVTHIRQKDFLAVRKLLTDPALVTLLDLLADDTEIDSVDDQVDNASFDDYAEEK
jgi:hypothetical protein